MHAFAPLWRPYVRSFNATIRSNANQRENYVALASVRSLTCFNRQRQPPVRRIRPVAASQRPPSQYNDSPGDDEEYEYDEEGEWDEGDELGVGRQDNMMLGDSPDMGMGPDADMQDDVPLGEEEAESGDADGEGKQCLAVFLTNGYDAIKVSEV